MPTILYDNNLKSFISDVFMSGYYVDGKKENVLPPIYELEIIDPAEPSINKSLEYLTNEWSIDLDNKTYTRTWTKHSKPENDIALYRLSWNYPEYAIRILAPVLLGVEYPGFKALWDLRELPIQKIDNDYIYMYCDYIEPNFQDLVLQLSSSALIQLEGNPTMEITSFFETQENTTTEEPA